MFIQARARRLLLLFTVDSDAKDSAGSKRRHIETVSQVALTTMDSDAKVIAGLKRKHMGIMSQVTLPIVGSDAQD